MSTVQSNSTRIKMEDEISLNCNITDSSISSEEDVASETDFEEKIRVKAIQEIWSSEEIRECLMSLSGAEIMYEQLNDEDMPLETGELDTLLLLASWLGNERGVKFALEQGQNPNVTDSEGRYYY